MLLDSEQQKDMLVKIIDATQINGSLSNSIQLVSTLMQLRQEVQNAKVGECCNEQSCDCTKSGLNTVQG